MPENAIPAPVWCLLGKKAGDNTQVRALAEELGLGYEEKFIAARPWELLVHFRKNEGQGTLDGINPAASTPLRPPWPDLVITAGRRNEEVARWIRSESQGKARLVHLGRPWSPPGEWDLVVTTPQYFLRDQPNIVHNNLPLHRPNARDMAEAAAFFRGKFEHLPKPWIALLVGGDSGQFVFTRDKAVRLAELAESLAEACGGSLLVSDSPRTPVRAGDALQARLRRPHYCYRCNSGEGNPYQALLALADAFVVTGESMSMLGEASDTGRPLFIFDMADDPVIPWWKQPHQYRYKPLSHRVAMRCGPERMRRDIGRIQDELVSSGCARWLEPAAVAQAVQGFRSAGAAEEAANEPARTVSQQDLKRAARAVRRLLIAR